MSIYSDLLDLGYTHEQIMEKRRASTRQFTVQAVETPDGVPIVGISYTCDFRAEEEYGVGDLYKALGISGHDYQMAAGATAHIARFTDVTGLIITKDEMMQYVFQWGSDITRKPVGWSRDVIAWGDTSADAVKYASYENYATHYKSNLASAQGVNTPFNLRYRKMDELRDYAREAGIEGTLPRKKDDLVDAIIYAGHRETPDVWPGYFHHGDALILRADEGIAADVLSLLFKAGMQGTLALGGGSQVFGSGLGLYDGADVGPKLRKERKEAAKWYDKQMKRLKPVEDKLKAEGFKWYFLGKPSIITDEKGSGRVIKYWLNGTGSSSSYGSNGINIPAHPQPFGWYTLEELLAHKFVDDAIERAAKRR